MMRLVYEEDGKQKEYVIRGTDPIRIGRDPECEIPTKNKSVSRRHATLAPEGDKLRVHDDGGANGVFVNDEKVTDAVLKQGDVLRVGKFQLTFSGEEAAGGVEAAAGGGEEGTIVDASFGSGSDAAPGGLVAKVAAAARSGGGSSPDDIAKLFSAAAAQAAPPPPPPGAAVMSPAAPGAAPAGAAAADQLKPGVPIPQIEILKGMPAQTLEINAKKITLGTQGDNLVVLKADGISRHHTEIVFKDKSWVLRDLGSKNGTYVNGKKATEATLRNGDAIAIGQVQLRFRVKAAAGAGGAGDAKKKKLILVAGVIGFVVLLAGLKIMLPADDGSGPGGPGVSKEVCPKCSKPGHKLAECPYTIVSSQYSDVAVRLDRAREARFRDASANAELDTVLNKAWGTGLKIKAAYNQPPIEQPTIKTLLELLQTFREKAQDDFKDFKWKEPRDRTAEIQVNREIFVPLKEAAGKLLEWIEVESKMSETLREGEDYAINNNDEDAYKTYAKVRDDSVYAGVAHKRREEIKDRYKDRRTREVDAKMSATEYEAALKLINETLDLFGSDYADITSEMIPRQTECQKYIGTEKILNDVAQFIKKAEFDTARKKLNEVQPNLLRVEWVKKKVVALGEEIETQSLLTTVTQKYNEGQGEAAAQLLAPRIGTAREEVSKLLERIQDVLRTHKDMVDARDHNDWMRAREKALHILDVEKIVENKYRKDAEEVSLWDAPRKAKEAFDLATKQRSDGDALEATARVLFDAQKMGEALGKCDEAAKKFADARDNFEKAKTYISGSHEEIKKLFKDAEKAYNLNRNLALPVERRLGLLRIALAKLSVSGGNDEKAKRAEISGLITKLELEAQK